MDILLPKFKIGDEVIGVNHPDSLINAVVIDIKSDDWVYIIFNYKGKDITRLVNKDRIILITST